MEIVVNDSPESHEPKSLHPSSERLERMEETLQQLREEQQVFQTQLAASNQVSETTTQLQTLQVQITSLTEAVATMRAELETALTEVETVESEEQEAQEEIPSIEVNPADTEVPAPVSVVQREGTVKHFLRKIILG